VCGKSGTNHDGDLNRVTVHRFRVQRSGLRTKKVIKDPKFSLKMLIFLNNCQFGSKFWIRPDEADAFLEIPIPNAVQGGEWNLDP
jgi:hypothetical protein